jgi:diguanylate cyclase (GGDEF)-like protein
VTLENLRLIDKLRMESAEREHQAMHDELTMLPNRAHLYRSLDRRLQGGAESVAVAVLDLNQFKDVNDTLGHHAGDEVLVEAARRLRRDLPASAFVARLGGDEFAIVLQGFAKADEAVERMGVLERVFAAPFELEDMTLRIDAAIGVAVAPEDGTDRTTLLKRADVAMYAAKKVHGSAVRRYDKTQEQTSGRNLEIVAALRAAMDSGHITLAFQPKADLASGRIPGVEALVRWNDPRLGVIPPNEFIPLAEQAGLIGALTDTVLSKALTACAQWTAAGRALSVAVNVDAQTLLSPGFVTRVKSEVRRVGLSASALTLEITERELVRELNDAASVIGELRDYGIAFSIDDFGTGYSALSYLTRLPVDEIKIDRSFVVGVAESPDHAAIVKAIADMATSLSLTTVVEGIEDDATWKTVTRLGCTYGQGYHLARPMPNEQFMEWLDAHSPLPIPPGSAVGALADLRDVVAPPILRAQKVALAPAE